MQKTLGIWATEALPGSRALFPLFPIISALHFLSPSPIIVPVLAKLCSAVVSGIEAYPVWSGQGEGFETVPRLASAIPFWRLLGREL
jgi:hypothetical protein